MAKKRGELAVGELVTVLLSIATLVLGFFLIRAIHQKQTNIVNTGISSSLLQNYESFVSGKLSEGEKMAAYPKLILAKDGENPFFVLGVRNEGASGEFAIKTGIGNFIYNNLPFKLQENEIRLFTISINTQGMKGSKPYAISALKSEGIYATAEILVDIEQNGR